MTMKNAELDSRGVLSLIVAEKGTVDSFKVCLCHFVAHIQFPFKLCMSDKLHMHFLFSYSS